MRGKDNFMSMNEYPENPHYDLALSLWCYYRVVCEEYDREVCTGTGDRGVAIPMNRYEYESINRHAQKVRKQITQIATDYHVIPQDFADSCIKSLLLNLCLFFHIHPPIVMPPTHRRWLVMLRCTHSYRVLNRSSLCNTL